MAMPAAGPSGRVIARLSVSDQICAIRDAVAGTLRRNRRLLPGSPLTYFLGTLEDRRGGSANRDPARSTERCHGGNFDDFHTAFAGRPEQRLRDPPIGILRDEYDPRLTAADRLRRLVRADRALRRRFQTLHVHDRSTEPLYSRRT
jgi:hypothetical protein